MESRITGWRDRGHNDEPEPFQNTAEQKHRKSVRSRAGKTRRRHGEKPDNDQAAMAQPVPHGTGDHAEGDAQKIENRNDPDPLIEGQTKLIADDRQCGGCLSDLERSRYSGQNQNADGKPVGPR